MKKLSGDFIHHLTSSLIFPLDEQDHIGTGKDFWCLDWWIIEICKYFFEGEKGYLHFPIARRLIGNNIFKKEDIVNICRERYEILNSPILRLPDTVCVIEGCRGLDTIMINSVREWKKIYVIIDSKYPQVIGKTTKYLERFSNVEIIKSIDEDIAIINFAKINFAKFGGGK